MRLIDADALLDSIENPYQRREIARWVDSAPVIDVIKRCEDCKHGYIAFIDSDEVVACKKKKAYMAKEFFYEACSEYER